MMGAECEHVHVVNIVNIHRGYCFCFVKFAKRIFTKNIYGVGMDIHNVHKFTGTTPLYPSALPAGSAILEKSKWREVLKKKKRPIAAFWRFFDEGVNVNVYV